MGSEATGGLAVAGAVAASFTPMGWVAGAEIGMTIGSMFTRSKAPNSDIRATTAQYGQDIPQFWGNVTLGSQLIWGFPINENSSGGGKKGGEPQYSACWAVSLGESRPNTTLGRVWLDDILFLDNISGGSGGSVSGAPSTAVLCAYFGFSTAVYAALSASQQAAWQQEYYDQHAPYFQVFVDSPSLRLHVGGPSQQCDTLYLGTYYNYQTSAPTGTGGGSPAYRHLTTLTVDNFALQAYGNRIPSVRVQLVETGVTLDQVVTDICLREGFASSQIDVSRITGIAVDGLVRHSATGFNEFLDTILTLYQCDKVQVDNVMRIVPRGGASVATIPLTDLGASSAAGKEPQAPYTLTITDEKDVPFYVELDFLDAWNLNQTAPQFAQRTDTISLLRQKLSCDIVLNDTQAQTMVTQILYAAWQDRYKYEFEVGWKYAWLCPTDILTLWNGDRVRITEIGIGTMAELKITAVRDGGGVPSITGTVGGTAAANPTINTPGSTQFHAWSGQELNNLDGANPGFYVAADGATNGNTSWQGCDVYYSPDSGTTWINAGHISEASTIGVALTALNTTSIDAPAWDSASAVSIATFAGGQLQSTTSGEVLVGGNEALIGGELVGFTTATPTAGAPNYQYNLGTFQRGLRGTASSGHVVGEPFVLVSSPGPLRVQVATSLIGETIQVKCVGAFDTLSDVTAVNVVISTPNTPYVTTGGLSAAIALAPKPIFFRCKGYVDTLTTSTVAIDQTYFDSGANFPGGTTQMEFLMSAEPDGGLIRDFTQVPIALWAKYGLTNPTAAAITVSWWIPRADDYIAYRWNGAALTGFPLSGPGVVQNQFGTITIAAGASGLFEIFYYNESDGSGSPNPGNCQFIWSPLLAGLTWYDPGP